MAATDFIQRFKETRKVVIHSLSPPFPTYFLTPAPLYAVLTTWTIHTHTSIITAASLATGKARKTDLHKQCTSTIDGVVSCVLCVVIAVYVIVCISNNKPHADLVPVPI